MKRKSLRKSFFVCIPGLFYPTCCRRKEIDRLRVHHIVGFCIEFKRKAETLNLMALSQSSNGSFLKFQTIQGNFAVYY